MENDIINIDSITKAHCVLGIEKPKHPLVSVLHHKNMKIKEELKGKTYSIGLFRIALKDGNCGLSGYGRNSYDFHEGTTVFACPGQILNAEGELFDEEMNGWTLLFHPDFIHRYDLGKLIEQYSFFSYDIDEALHLSHEEKSNVTELVKKIEKEFSQNIDKHSQKLMVSNIELLLDYCTRYYDRQFYTRSNLNKDIVNDFWQVLKDYYESQRPLENGVPTVRFCGNELGLSPNYLNDLLKNEIGKTAQESIHDFVVDKASVKLLNTTDSVGQIARTLGFAYQQYFTKIFKLKTGMSPSTFRMQN